ncbi:hypothetical protein QZH41_012879 [Actinostola sp. cb2023]|nr:hypothetical protein QZH41_012879 [Actinostola sp. cb2023]
MMTEDFKLLSTTSSISKILCGVFNETVNEVITGGIGNITCWCFRYGAKFLLQRKVFTDGLSADSVVSHICLEETPSRAQRCFASYDTNVIIHSLLDGRCLAHYKDLHSREITALLFFNPLKFPVRMLCTCSDNTVRLISPGSGSCITTLLVPGMSTIADVVYAAADNLLFTLFSNGSILKASTKTNPCKIIDEWDKESTKVPSTCSCLCLYEYVVEDNIEDDQWGDLVRSTLKANQTSLDHEFDSVSKPSTYDRTILLGGCIDGTIVVYDWQNKKNPGSISFLIEAHREEIVTMIANPAVDQVISASYDNTIKIWRLFPFAVEALAPLMTLYCQETPKHLAVAHHRLFVSLHEPATASYNVVVFKTTQKERFDHNSDADHTDDVTGVASCPKMRLFASSSADGSVRIWDESNHLLRVIALNAVPSSLCFCSQKGDLFIGIGNHIHKIEYATYMPHSYIFRMVAMEFQRPVSEHPLPIDPEVKVKLSPDELQRLTRAKSSVFKFERFADLLSPEEMDEKAEEEERRNQYHNLLKTNHFLQAFAKIKQRENELKKLRDGVFEFEKRKRCPNSEMVRQDAFNRYLAIFYKRPDVQIPDEDEDDRKEGLEYEVPNKFTPDRQPVGFFGIDKNSRQSTRAKKEQRPAINQEIMSLSMPEFRPLAAAAAAARSPEPEEQEKEEDGLEFVVSRQGTEVDMDTQMEVERPGFGDHRSHSMVVMKTKDYRTMAVEPPLIGSPKRDRFIIDVPKTEQYPSSIMCRHMVARRAVRMISRRVSDSGDEEFVIAPDGFIPNSVVVSLFKDLKSATPKEDVQTLWKPPALTAEQLAEIDKRKKKRVPTPEEEEVFQFQPKKKSAKKINRFSEQMKLALRDTPTPEHEPLVDLLKSPSPTPPPSPTPKEPTPPGTTTPKPRPKSKREAKPMKPIEKLVSRPKPPTPPPNESFRDFEIPKVTLDKSVDEKVVLLDTPRDTIPCFNIEQNIEINRPVAGDLLAVPFGSPDDGNAPSAFGSPDGGNAPLSFGSADGGNAPLSFGSPDGGNAPLSFGSPDGGNAPLSFGSPDGGNAPSAFGSPDGGNAPLSFVSPDGGNVPLSFGSPDGGNAPLSFGSPDGGNAPLSFGSPDGGNAPLSFGSPDGGNAPLIRNTNQKTIKDTPLVPIVASDGFRGCNDMHPIAPADDSLSHVSSHDSVQTDNSSNEETFRLRLKPLSKVYVLDNKAVEMSVHENAHEIRTSTPFSSPTKFNYDMSITRPSTSSSWSSISATDNIRTDMLDALQVDDPAGKIVFEMEYPRNQGSEQWSLSGDQVLGSPMFSQVNLGMDEKDSGRLESLRPASVPPDLDLCNIYESSKESYSSNNINTPLNVTIESNCLETNDNENKINTTLLISNKDDNIDTTTDLPNNQNLLRPTPPREPTPTPSPPPTPLPEFITQFKGTLWFEKYFPDAQPATFPKPWSVSVFVDMLLQILQKCSDHELKTQILAAILLLNRQDPFEKSCCERVSRTILAELNVPDPPTAHGSSAANQFLRVSLQLLQVMQVWNKSFVAELMAHYIDGDEEVRRLIQELFVSIEIRDPAGYFPKELDNFETEHLIDNRRKARVRELCLNWLEKWLTQFKKHIKSLAGKIGRAQSGSIVKGTKDAKTPTSVKSILKKDEKYDGSKAKVKFDIENMGRQAADSATPVEAINYFCEMQLEEELDRARERSRAKTPQKAADNSRNTVLILPNIHSKRSLARLGETHCSHCHPERETSLSLAFPLPPIYQQKKEIPLTNVALHLKTLTLNPFHDDVDMDLYEATKHARLLTLRSSQKYFIPSQSIVTMFEDML